MQSGYLYQFCVSVIVIMLSLPWFW